MHTHVHVAQYLLRRIRSVCRGADKEVREHRKMLANTAREHTYAKYKWWYGMVYYLVGAHSQTGKWANITFGM